ncbi:MAG: GatB/YqeY domain-containing protein [Acetobacteraceae bacterium]|nr:GatB/YqeY domain-containing protein [Acetobacteraceae bacterium]MCX7685185.1 GatB/YqeY domain-containing protein [Acetobacteraceae bacterium]MDW8397322.1 GatB/YqeY domain-containing protein [Acetobacteraceae bacterium]
MSDLRTRFTEALKEAMRAADAPRTSTIRMILAKLKETDIAARPSGVDKVPDEQIVQMLRGMVKSRRESAELYRQGNRPDLVAKEEAEIAVIESFLPPEMDEAALEAAIAAAIAETGATAMKDMGKVMAALKAKHGAALDLGRAGPKVKAALS